jgi:hypothetical protein
MSTINGGRFLNVDESQIQQNSNFLIHIYKRIENTHCSVHDYGAS